MELTRLNLGSGTHYADGWTNVDKFPAADGSRDADVLCDLYEMDQALPAGWAQACYIGHVLEHLVWDRIPEAMAQVRRTLVPGAPVMAVGPCILKAIETRQPLWLIEDILSDPRSEFAGGDHAWTPTTELTRAAMEASGFVEVRVVPIGTVVPPEWPNPTTAAWQCAVAARNPG